MAVVLKQGEGSSLSPQSLIIFQILCVLYVKFFVDNGTFPHAMNYLCDLLNVITFCFSFGKIMKTFEKIKAKVFLAIMVTMVVTAVVGVLLNDAQITLAIWGARNTGRMFIFWINCIVLMDYDGLINAFRYIIIAYIINFGLSLYQYFAMGKAGDNLGGLFGPVTGAHSYTLIFLILGSFFVITMYLQKQMPLYKMLLVLVLAIVLAPMAELRAFFFVFPALFVVTLILQRKMSMRLFLTIALGVVVIIGAIQVLSIVFPKSVETLSLENAKEYAMGTEKQGYSSADDLSRLGAIPTLYDKFMDDSTSKNLFGMGLGSTDTSGYDFFNSEFYEKYNHLHYNWFFDAMIYLELGVLGLVEFALFYILIFLYGRNKLKGLNPQQMAFTSLGCIVAAYAVFSAVYNATLRVEAGYLVYLALACPFIIEKCRGQYISGIDKKVFKLSRVKVKISK